MCDKRQKRAKLMMELQQQNLEQQNNEPLQQSTRELDDQLFHRRRTRWLVYGRAILTIATLGLLTVVLYNITHSQSPESHQEEQRSRLIYADGGTLKTPHRRSVSIEDETVRKLNDDETATKSEHRLKRNVPKIVVNSVSAPSAGARNGLKDENDIQLDTDDEIGHVEKLQRRVVNQPHHNSHRHRHSDGDIYYLKGYKCVPITKSPSSKSRSRLPGMFNSHHSR